MFSRVIGDSAELRLLEERHAEAVFEQVERNRAELRQWLPWVDGCRSTDDVRTFIRQSLTDFAQNNGLHAGIWLAGRLVGVIGLHAIDWTHRNSSIGYWLAAEAQGRGLMTAACGAVLDHAFGELKLHRMEIHCAPENQKSCAIPVRLGFIREGVLRHDMLISGRYVDSVVYAMLEDEWRAARPDGPRNP